MTVALAHRVAGDGPPLMILHGLFGSDQFRAGYLRALGAAPDLADHGSAVEDTLDALAAHVATHLDLDLLLALAEDIPGARNPG